MVPTGFYHLETRFVSADSSLDRGFAGRASDSRSTFMQKYGFSCENMARAQAGLLVLESQSPYHCPKQTMLVSQGALVEVIGYSFPE